MAMMLRLQTRRVNLHRIIILRRELGETVWVPLVVEILAHHALMAGLDVCAAPLARAGRRRLHAETRVIHRRVLGAAHHLLLGIGGLGWEMAGLRGGGLLAELARLLFAADEEEEEANECKGCDGADDDAGDRAAREAGGPGVFVFRGFNGLCVGAGFVDAAGHDVVGVGRELGLAWRHGEVLFRGQVFNLEQILVGYFTIWAVRGVMCVGNEEAYGLTTRIIWYFGHEPLAEQ